MKLNFNFRESNQSFNLKFGEIQTASDGGFERGYAEGYTKGETSAKAEAEAHNAEILTDCNAVLPSKGVETADRLEQVPQRIGEIQSYSDGYDVGVEDGKQAEYDRFWDAFQQNGTRANYTNGFNGEGWNDTTFKPKYDIVIGMWDTGVFGKSHITDLKGILEAQGVSLDTSKATSCSSWFANSTVTRVPPIDAKNVTGFSSTFHTCTRLQEVELNNFREDATGNAQFFQSCTSLVTLKFTGTIAMPLVLSGSPLLSNDSVQSVIDCLKDLTGQTAKKVTFHTDVLLKLTEEQIATILAKNWEF